MVHGSHQHSVVTARMPLYRWAGDQMIVPTVVAPDKAVALQLATLEVVGELAPQAQGGILAGREQGIQHSSVLKPTGLVNHCSQWANKYVVEVRRKATGYPHELCALG